MNAYPSPLTIHDFFDLSGCTPKQVAALKRRMKPEMAEIRNRRKQTAAAVAAVARLHNHLFAFQLHDLVMTNPRVYAAWAWETCAIRDLKREAAKCFKRYNIEPKSKHP